MSRNKTRMTEDDVVFVGVKNDEEVARFKIENFVGERKVKTKKAHASPDL